MLKILSLDPMPSIANEGIFDIFKGSKGISKEKASEIFKAAVGSNRKNADKSIAKLFDETVFSDKFFTSNFKQGEERKPLASQVAFIAGENTTDIKKIAKVASEDMLKKVQEIVKALAPNTALRRKLFAMIMGKESSYADEVFEKYEDQLFSSPSKYWKDHGGKGIDAVGCANSKTWPLFVYTDKATGKKILGELDGWIDTAPEGCVFPRPNLENYRDFVAAAKAILAAVSAAQRLYDDCYVDYWEGLDLDYDALRYGDEIYDMIATGQNDVLHDLPRALRDGYIAILEEIYYAFVVK